MTLKEVYRYTETLMIYDDLLKKDDIQLQQAKEIFAKHFENFSSQDFKVIMNELTEHRSRLQNESKVISSYVTIAENIKRESDINRRAIEYVKNLQEKNKMQPCLSAQ